MEDIKESKTSNKGGTNGSVAGLGATDLERGYTDEGVDEYANQDATTFEQQQGGFLKRPSGWDR